MSWNKELQFRDFNFCITSGCFSSITKGEVVGFFLRDEKTRIAIKNRDPRIFEILDLIIEEGDDLCNALWAGDGAWWDHIATGANYKEILESLVSNRFASDSVKREAKAELGKIASKTVKRKLTRQRRIDFQAKRKDLMLALIDRTGYICATPDCMACDDLTIDHIIPISKGGTDDLDNLQLLCRHCNSSKGDR